MPGERSDLATPLELLAQRRSKPPHRDRRVFVDVNVSTQKAQFVIRDEGPGFDVSSLPDLLDSTIGKSEGGRGVSLMLTFMDEVTYNDVGNQVTLIKYRDEIGAEARKTAAGAGK